MTPDAAIAALNRAVAELKDLESSSSPSAADGLELLEGAEVGRLAIEIAEAWIVVNRTGEWSDRRKLDEALDDYRAATGRPRTIKVQSDLSANAKEPRL